eukprot:118960_1
MPVLCDSCSLSTSKFQRLRLIKNFLRFLHSCSSTMKHTRRRKPIGLIRLLFIIFIFLLTGIHMSRKSKRKQEEAFGADFNNEHVNKRYKSLCSGLLQYESSTLVHLKRYYHIFNLDYNGLSLESLHQARNDTYFFCNGNGCTATGSSQCIACINGSKIINSSYNLFDQVFVNEICLFMDEYMTKTNWKSIQIFSTGDIGDEIEVTVTVDKQDTNNRMIKWVISNEKMVQINDIAAKIISKSDSNITHSYLLNHFKKWLPNSVVICGGVVGRDWYKEETFRNTKTVKWINGGKIIAHIKCPIKNGKRKLCNKCKPLQTRIDRTQNKDNYDKTPSKHTSTQYLNTIQKDLRIKALQSENEEMKNEILRQDKELKALKKLFSLDMIIEDAKLNQECGLMIQYILRNYQQIKGGLTERGINMSKVNFLFDQFKYAHRTWIDWTNGSGHNKRKGHRWSSATIQFAEDLLCKGSGAYKKAQKSPALQLPSQGTIKRGIIKWRHTDQSASEIMDQIERAFILHFGSMEEARRHIYDGSLDECILSNEANINVSNFDIDGRAAFHTSDGLLKSSRHLLYVAKNHLIDDVNGSKYMMQFILRSSTSNFVYIGPFFGSESGLNCIEILSYIEEDFLAPLKVNHNIEIKSLHGDLNRHHQSYILYKTGKKNLRQLLNGPIELKTEFYDDEIVLWVSDKDHSTMDIQIR